MDFHLVEEVGVGKQGLHLVPDVDSHILCGADNVFEIVHVKIQVLVIQWYHDGFLGKNIWKKIYENLICRQNVEMVFMWSNGVIMDFYVMKILKRFMMLYNENINWVYFETFSKLAFDSEISIRKIKIN